MDAMQKNHGDRCLKKETLRKPFKNPLIINGIGKWLEEYLMSPQSIARKRSTVSFLLKNSK
jgi:hypothetical protein